MKTLYITDLDGTLLDNDARISPRSAAILSNLSRRGALISIATARTPATVVPLLADTHADTDLVVMTGAATWNRREARFDDIITIAPDQARKVMQVIDDSEVSPFCYTLSPDRHCLEVYHSGGCYNAAEQEFVDERSNLALKTFHPHCHTPEDALDRMVLAFAIGAHQPIVDVAERLRYTTDCYVSYYKDTYHEDTWLLEIFAQGVSKAAGVQRLARRLGADRIVAFGDNLNDIPMLNVATVGVAVDNALDEVKGIADVVIGANTDDSVALYIQEDFYNTQQ